ncbi:MAG: chalcone isomerase family protein [Gammaproteobacteria bacterium]
MTWRWLTIAAVGATWAAAAAAQELEGVQVPAEVTVQDTTLVLNGAGVRWKLFVKAYVGALYLSAPTHIPQQAIAAPGPKCIRLVLLRDVEASSMVEELLTRFRANSTDEVYRQLQERIDELNGALPDLRAGDIVRLDLADAGRTDFWINDALVASFGGADFQTAVLKLWLGDRPADERLKQALLGLT